MYQTTKNLFLNKSIITPLENTHNRRKTGIRRKVKNSVKSAFFCIVFFQNEQKKRTRREAKTTYKVIQPFITFLQQNELNLAKFVFNNKNK